MAFTVEDGSGVVDANAYVSVAFADTYHSDRNQHTWDDLNDDEKEGFIVRASDYIDKRFGRKFRGFRQTKNQGLEWPRLDAFDDDDYVLDEIPSQLQKATSEYALRAIDNDQLAPDNEDTGLDASFTKVGPIEIEDTIKQFGGSSLVAPTSIKDYPEADLWMSELLIPSNSRDLSRA
jgi:hypothetical protein